MSNNFEETMESENGANLPIQPIRESPSRFVRLFRWRNDSSTQTYVSLPNTSQTEYDDENAEPWYRKANAEPLIFIFSLSFGVFTSMMSLFLYWARCIEIFSDSDKPAENVTSICIGIMEGNNTKLVDLLEKDITNMNIYLTAMGTLTTFISAPILGHWADGSGGRRLPLIICLTGLVFYCGIHTLSVFFFTTVNVYYFQFLAHLVQGSLGGLVSVFTLSSAIVVDDSKIQQTNAGSSTVPVRIGISSAAQAVGMLLGNVVSDELMIPIERGADAHVRGYLYSFAFMFSTALLALLYAIFWLRDSYGRKESIREPNPANVPTASCSNHFKSVRQFVFEIFEVITEKREGHVRLCLNLCIVFLFVDFLAFGKFDLLFSNPTILDNTLLTMMVKRAPFSWDDSKFSHFILLRSFLSAIGMALMPFIMDKTNFIGKESVMIMIGIAAFIAASLMLSFATGSIMVFGSTIFALMVGGISPGYRTLMPKMVPQEQTARLFSFVGIIIVLCPLLSSLIFNNIYNATMDSWPGCVFMVYAVLNFSVLCGQMGVHVLMLPIWKRNAPTVDEDENFENPNFE